MSCESDNNLPIQLQSICLCKRVLQPALESLLHKNQALKFYASNVTCNPLKSKLSLRKHQHKISEQLQIRQGNSDQLPCFDLSDSSEEKHDWARSTLKNNEKYQPYTTKLSCYQGSFNLESSTPNHNGAHDVSVKNKIIQKVNRPISSHGNKQKTQQRKQIRKKLKTNALNQVQSVNLEITFQRQEKQLVTEKAGEGSKKYHNISTDQIKQSSKMSHFQRKHPSALSFGGSTKQSNSIFIKQGHLKSTQLLKSMMREQKHLIATTVASENPKTEQTQQKLPSSQIYRVKDQDLKIDQEPFLPVNLQKNANSLRLHHKKQSRVLRLSYQPSILERQFRKTIKNNTCLNSPNAACSKQGPMNKMGSIKEPNLFYTIDQLVDENMYNGDEKYNARFKPSSKFFNCSNMNNAKNSFLQSFCYEQEQQSQKQRKAIEFYRYSMCQDKINQQQYVHEKDQGMRGRHSLLSPNTLFKEEKVMKKSEILDDFASKWVQSIGTSKNDDFSEVLMTYRQLITKSGSEKQFSAHSLKQIQMTKIQSERPRFSKNCFIKRYRTSYGTTSINHFVTLNSERNIQTNNKGKG